jgi:hypothetical protein
MPGIPTLLSNNSRRPHDHSGHLAGTSRGRYWRRGYDLVLKAAPTNSTDLALAEHCGVLSAGIGQ